MHKTDVKYCVHSNRKLILTERDTEDHFDNSNNKTCTDW